MAIIARSCENLAMSHCDPLPKPDNCRASTGILEALAGQFELAGVIETITPLGQGLINETYLVVTSQAKGVLQRLNGRVFADPAILMTNLRTVTRHLRRQSEPGVTVPAIIPAGNGRDWLIGEDGECWRMLEYLENCRTLHRVDHPETARWLGWSLGRLHRLLADLDPAGLQPAIANFHVTPHYLERFDQALGRWRGKPNATLDFCLAAIERRRAGAAVLEQAKERGQLPLRVIHGDPKLDNVLFSDADNRPRAWIDLDTLGPGLVHYDIGDCLRSACSVAGEDGQPGYFDLDLAQALLQGWHEEAREFLTGAEKALVIAALELLPFELGLRFVTDYLEGNVYFKTRHPLDNLDKAHRQLQLADSIERNSGRLQAIWRAIQSR